MFNKSICILVTTHSTLCFSVCVCDLGQYTKGHKNAASFGGGSRFELEKALQLGQAAI